MTVSRPLVVTAGEPAGIGPELCLALAAARPVTDFAVISDAALLRERAAQIGSDVEIIEVDAADVGDLETRAGELFVMSLPFPESPQCGTT